MLEYLVGGHLADRVPGLERLELLQTPVQLVQSLDGQLLVRLLCAREKTCLLFVLFENNWS